MTREDMPEMKWIPAHPSSVPSAADSIYQWRHDHSFAEAYLMYIPQSEPESLYAVHYVFEKSVEAWRLPVTGLFAGLNLNLE